MSTAALIPISEYLATTYRPDCDYVDGELLERNAGERPHATLQTVMAGIINANRKLWHVVALTELRVQVSPSRFRIPDVSILRRSDPVEPIVHTAPLVCIEVLSPEDTLSSLQARIDDYAAMGVESIWVLDPLRRRAYAASESGLQQPPTASSPSPKPPSASPSPTSSPSTTTSCARANPRAVARPRLSAAALLPSPQRPSLLPSVFASPPLPFWLPFRAERGTCFSTELPGQQHPLK